MSIDDTNPYAAPNHEPGFGSTLQENNGTLTVAYDFTREDYIDYNLFVTAQRRPYRRTHWIMLGAFLFGASLLLWTGSFENTEFLIPVFIVIGSFIAFFPIIIRQSVRSAAGRMVAGNQNRFLFGRKRLSVNSEELLQTGEHSELKLKWEIVDDVVKSDASLYIFLGSVQAIIVPRRAFGSDAEFDGFFDRLRSFAKVSSPEET